MRVFKKWLGKTVNELKEEGFVFEYYTDSDFQECEEEDRELEMWTAPWCGYSVWVKNNIVVDTE